MELFIYFGVMCSQKGQRVSKVQCSRRLSVRTKRERKTNDQFSAKFTTNTQTWPINEVCKQIYEVNLITRFIYKIFIIISTLSRLKQSLRKPQTASFGFSTSCPKQVYHNYILQTLGHILLYVLNWSKVMSFEVDSTFEYKKKSLGPKS